jgi:Cu(I)/Ag(I) efflux system membrane fusion protein
VSGTLVKKGTPLFSAYSADIYQTMGEYIAAKQRGGDAVARIGDAARLKLQLAGFYESQLRELDAKKEASTAFIFHSPFDGMIVEKKIQEGSYFSEGTALYELVDVSRLWNIVEVAEADAAQLQQGMTGELTVTGAPGKIYPVRLSLFYPSLNKQNRTVKIRTELLRADKALRAQMYGETKFHIRLGQGILIPGDAVLFTGKRQLVYVRTGEQKFAAREIQVGSRVGENYLVTSGLAAGEEIAVSGGYLLDSESQLRYGGATATQHSENNATSPVQNPQPVGKQAQQKAEVPGDKNQQATAMNRNEAKPVAHVTKAATYIDKNDPMYKKMGIFNAVCPVLGEEISGNHPTVLYKGKIYGFCCRGCDKKFIADPEKFAHNLSPDGKTFVGQK